MGRTCLLLSLWLVPGLSLSAVTPLSPPLPEGETVRIDCEYFRPGGRDPVWYDEGAAQGAYSYSVRIPRGYYSSRRSHPCLFVMGSGPPAEAITLPERVDLEGWLVLILLGGQGQGGPVGSTTLSGRPGNAKGNLVAAYRDARRRLKIGGSFLFSIGGRDAADAAGMRTDFRGMICRSLDLSELFLNRVARNDKRRFAAYFPVGADPAAQGRRTGRAKPMSAYLAEKLLPRVRYRVEVHSGYGHSVPDESMADAIEWLERKVWLEAPTDRRRHDMYLWYCYSRFALYDAATTPLARYEVISDLFACIRRHQVRLDPKARQRRLEMREELKRLEQDPGLKDEIEARKLFLRIDALDDPARLVPRRGRDAATTVDAVIAAYEQVAERYPGTVYGRKAAERAGLLKAEWMQGLFLRYEVAAPGGIRHEANLEGLHERAACFFPSNGTC